jgi:SPP1 gp7 family putative phage head morphogenesis protein
MQREDDGSLTEAPPAADMNPQQIASLQSIITDVASGSLPLESAMALIAVAFPSISEDQAAALLGPAAKAEAEKPEPPAGPPVPPPPPPSAEDEAGGVDPVPPTPPAVPEEEVAAEAKAALVRKIDDQALGSIMASINDELVARVMVSNSRAVVAEFGADAIDSFGAAIDFDLDSPAAQEFIAAQAATRSSLIGATTRKRLGAALAAEMAAGPTQQSLIDVVQAIVVDAGKARADAIARTETTRSAGFAVQEAMQQAGLTEKEWLAVQDDRTRDTHAEMDGQRVPVSEAFQNPSGAAADFPGEFGIPEEDINCRCVVVAVDSLPDKSQRVEAWYQKASQMDRLEAGFARDLRAAFAAQAQEIAERIRGMNGL